MCRKNVIIILFIILISGLMSSCKDNSFQNNPTIVKQKTNDTNKQTSETQDNKDSVLNQLNQLGNDPNPSTGTTSPNLQQQFTEGCPKVNQNILILDFKSGWWAGDGGDFFDKILRGISDPCLGSVQIEYHHILQKSDNKRVFPSNQPIMTSIFGTGFMSPTPNYSTSFNKQSINNYSQVWILSGSDKDPLDMKINDVFFRSLLNELSQTKVNLFIGAGFGSITHINAIGNTIGIGSIFSTTQIQGQVLNPLVGVQILNYLTVGNELKQHVLFSNTSKIVDAVKTGGEIFGTYMNAYSDKIGNSPYIDIIGKDANGNSIIAVTKPEFPKKVVIDTGLQRFYSIKQQYGQDTLKYLQNIMIYLAN